MRKITCFVLTLVAALCFTTCGMTWTVREAAGLWYVQSLDMDKIAEESGDPVEFTVGNVKNFKVGYVGRKKSNPAVDVYMQLPDEKTYNAEFTFLAANGKSLLERKVKVGREKKTPGEYAVVRLFLNEDDLPKLDETSSVRVTI